MRSYRRYVREERKKLIIKVKSKKLCWLDPSETDCNEGIRIMRDEVEFFLPRARSYDVLDGKMI